LEVLKKTVKGESEIVKGNKEIIKILFY